LSASIFPINDYRIVPSGGGLGGVVGLMLPLALAAVVRVPYTTSPCSDLGQVVNPSLSVA